MKSSNIRYIPALDHLRGYAAIFIIFYHGVHIFGYYHRFGTEFTFNNWLRTDSFFTFVIIEGHTAVAFFMVLSGFIFTYGSYRKEIIYTKFIQNRLLRTYPLFVLLIFVGISAFPQKFSFISFLQTIVGLGNAPHGLTTGSFSEMFWAIGVEWQFYFLFPLLLIITNKNSPFYLLGLMSVFIIFRVLAFLEGANITGLAFFTIIGRIDQFLFGMLAAIYFLNHKIEGIKWIFIFIAATIGIWVSLCTYHMLGGLPNNGFFKVFWTTIEGLLWAVNIVSYIHAARYLPEICSKLLVSLGTISYSLYLIHFTVIKIVINTGMYHNFGLDVISNALVNTLLIVIPVVIIISVFTYNFVEKPFLSLRFKYHK